MPRSKNNPETDGEPVNRGPGRPRIWRDPAEKARAYRQSHEALLSDLQKQMGRARHFDTLAGLCYSTDRWQIVAEMARHFARIADTHTAADPFGVGRTLPPVQTDPETGDQYESFGPLSPAELDALQERLSRSYRL